MTTFIVHLHRKSGSNSTASRPTPRKPPCDRPRRADERRRRHRRMRRRPVRPVEVEGDEDHVRSVTIDFEPERHRKLAPKLLASLEAILPYAENEAYSLEKHKDSPEAEAEADRAWKAIDSAHATIAEAKAAGIPPLSATGHRPARFQFTHEPEDNPDRAYVLVDGKFDVKIVRTGEGIVIDAYSGDGIDIVGTMTVWDEDVAEPEQDAAEGA